MKRDKRGRFAKQYRQASFADKLLVMCAIVVTIGIVAHNELERYLEPQPVEAVETVEEVIEPKTVLIEVRYSKEGIIDLIHETFPDAPVMVEVARCESGFDPEAFNPTNTSNDRGIFQISDLWQKSTWKKLGYTDMHDVKQNIEYARYLYDKYGLQPWSASKHCWS